MRDFFKGFKFKIIVCVFALVLGVVIYAAVSGGFSTFPENVLSTIAKPFVSVSNAVSQWVEDTLDKFANADRYKSENEELKDKLNEQYRQIIELENVKHENDQLKEILKIKEENSDFEFSAPCNIIAHNSNDAYAGFTIDRGSDDGISLYDPVMTSNGLIGMVSEIAPNYAKVSTILSDEINVGVMTFDSKVTGILDNDIKNANEGNCLMSYITKDSGIKKGEIVKSVAGDAARGQRKIPEHTRREGKQSEEYRRGYPARQARVRHGRLRQRQILAHKRNTVQDPRRREEPRQGAPRQVRRDRRA